MKVGWLAGWGIEPVLLQARVEAAFPTLNHEVVLPGKIEPHWPQSFQMVVGWSWGAFRLLEWALQREELADGKAAAEIPKLFFIAPFSAFCSEAGQGGRSSRSQVKWLRRWLKRDPLAALADFYQRAGLANPGRADGWASPDRDSPHLSFWERELEVMEAGYLTVPAGYLSQQAGYRKKGWIGQNDPLLDPSLVEKHLGVESIQGAGHDICDFFKFLTKEIVP